MQLESEIVLFKICLLGWAYGIKSQCVKCSLQCINFPKRQKLMFQNLFHIQVMRQAELITFHQINATCSTLGPVMILSYQNCSSVLPES